MGRPAKNVSSDFIPYGNPDETEQQILERIKKTFRVWDRVLDAVIAGRINAAVCSGAPGCGKSHSTEQKLLAEYGETSEDFKFWKGSSSAVDLYKTLFDYRFPGQKLVFDDCDNIWQNEESLNVLKAALDTKKKRIISWNKESWALLNPSEKTGENYPKEFVYEASCIFLTNVDLKSEVAKARKLSKHQGAVIDRGTYLDLGIHTKRELFVRTWQVMSETPFLKDNDIPLEDAQMILKWMRKNLTKIEKPGLRSVISLARFIATDKETWEETAEVTLFHR